MKSFINDIMVVSNKKYFPKIKKLLEEMGFHKLYIFPARSQVDAIFEISLIRSAGRDIDLLIFDYRDRETELEKIMNLKKLENGLATTIPKIVMLDPEKIQFVKNSDQFKKSEIIFIAEAELEETIKKSLRLEEE